MNTPLRLLALISTVGCLVFAGCAGGGSAPAAAGAPAKLGTALAPGSTLAFDAATAGTPFTPYRAAFARGDNIVIEKVVASSPKWGPGDTLTVSGHYQLASQPAASLALYVTARNPGEGRSVSTAKQRTTVAQGTGEFELTCTLPAGGGEPHVSFYPSGGGSVMGGVYFKSAAR